MFPVPNQTKTENPGTSSALKKGYPEEYWALKTGYSEEIGHLKVGTGRYCALKTIYPQKKSTDTSFFSG